VKKPEHDKIGEIQNVNSKTNTKISEKNSKKKKRPWGHISTTGKHVKGDAERDRKG